MKNIPKPTCLDCRRTSDVAHRFASTRGFCRCVTIFVTIAAALSAAGLLCLQPISAQANQAESTDRDNPAMVQAVFLYSIGRYVEWPESVFATRSSPFVIGILGDETFGGVLESIAAKKTIQGRKIQIRRFASLATYDQGCQILFVSQSVPPAESAALIEKTRGKPVFVVGAMAGLAEQGATADFATSEDRIVIEINADSVRKSRLRMDAKLLSLAKIVGASPTDQNN